MNILNSKHQKFILTFIDDEAIENINNKKQVIVPESIRDDVCIDYTQMLERQWEVQRDQVIFNSKIKMQTQRDKKIAKTAVVFNKQAEDQGLVTHRNKNKGIKSKIKLLDVQTVFQNPDPQQDIDLFLQSAWFRHLMRFFVIIYIIGIVMTDYSFRLQNLTTHVSSNSPSTHQVVIQQTNSSSYIQNSTTNSQNDHSTTSDNHSTQSNDEHSNQGSDNLSINNIISLHFQLLANCAFTLQIILIMFSKNKFFDYPWNIVKFLGCIACWGCLFLDMHQYDGYAAYHIICIIKVLHGIRLIQIFQFIKSPFQSFIQTIPELSKIFFPYFVFTTMYAVLGLILFIGANQSKCRITPQPAIDGSWPQVSINLCGSQLFKCKNGYCGNPYDYGLPYNTTQRYELGNQYGLVTFDSIGNSFLVIYHYVFLSNWSAIMFKFSRYINPYMTTLYFFTMALFLFFIMSNLNMITMCKSFIQKQKSKQKFKKENQPEIDQPDIQQYLSQFSFKVYTIFQYADIILIIFSSVIVLIQYEGMVENVRTTLNHFDFWLTLCCLSVVVIKTIILKKHLTKDHFMILDWIVLLLCVIDFIICAINRDNVINSNLSLSRVLRGIKIIRILKILYFSKNWFTFQKNILRMFVQTLNTVKFFLVLLLCVILILACIGQNIFAFKARFNHDTHQLDMQHGTPYIANFQSLYKAFIAVILLLQNQRWTQTMYNYYNAVGPVAIAYFTIVVFIIHLLLTRLFLAIFLCYFRRNLQKKSEIEQKLAEQAKHQLCCQNRSARNEQIVQYLQNKSDDLPSNIVKQQNQGQASKRQMNNNNDNNKIQQQQKISWIFKRNSCTFQFIRACYSSALFHRLIIVLICVHCLTIIIRTKNDSQQKIKILDTIQCIPLVFYIFQVAIGIVGYGLFWGNKTYLKLSKINYVNVIVVVIVIVSYLGCFNDMQSRIIRRFAIIKILTFLTRTSKQTSIVLDSISAIAQSFVRMIGVYMFLLILSCFLPMKLERDRLASCLNYGPSHSTPTNSIDCMLNGGDWIRSPQEFSNVFQSIVLMYQIVTAQSWLYYVQMSDLSQPWDIFFTINFFIYNLCLLNIFVGLTVQTYLSLKDEAYKLTLLRPNQRMWLLIRNCINQLIPIPMLKQPVTNSKIRKMVFKIISQSIYQNFMDVLPYINVLVYILKYYRADPYYLSTLNQINVGIIIIFMLDTVLKLQMHWVFFSLENSRIQLAGFLYHILWLIFVFTLNDSIENQRILQFGSALLLILRCKKLLFRFTWSKTLLNSVIDVLPKCVIIGALLAIILFLYISIGMQVFKQTKPSPKSDGYSTGFDNGLTSLLTLLKIVSNQSWFQQVSAFVRNSTPVDICFDLHSPQDVQNYPFMGCGSKAGYVYFISFHMIIALLVMNLLIATMVAAYDQNYQKQYKSVNVFQLQDCLKLWQKYDTDGTGVIPYKMFWRLSSEIAILFGISKKKLIKSKQKFLQQLDIQVCQSVDPKQNSVFCYKFHNVLTQFSKIKLTVSKLDGQQNAQYSDFEIHPMIERQIKDYTTKIPAIYEHIKPYKNFRSGEMKYFFGLLRKLRAWKIVAKKKDSSVISKLSHIIKVALQKKKQQQTQLSQIKSSLNNFVSSFK